MATEDEYVSTDALLMARVAHSLERLEDKFDKHVETTRVSREGVAKDFAKVIERLEHVERNQKTLTNEQSQQRQKFEQLAGDQERANAEAKRQSKQGLEHAGQVGDLIARMMKFEVSQKEQASVIDAQNVVLANQDDVLASHSRAHAVVARQLGVEDKVQDLSRSIPPPKKGEASPNKPVLPHLTTNSNRALVATLATAGLLVVEIVAKLLGVHL